MDDSGLGYWTSWCRVTAARNLVVTPPRGLLLYQTGPLAPWFCLSWFPCHTGLSLRPQPAECRAPGWGSVLFFFLSTLDRLTRWKGRWLIPFCSCAECLVRFSIYRVQAMMLSSLLVALSMLLYRISASTVVHTGTVVLFKVLFHMHSGPLNGSLKLTQSTFICVLIYLLDGCFYGLTCHKCCLVNLANFFQ